MCANKTDIHNPTNKNDYCYNTEIVTSNIENITSVLYIIC